MHKKKVEDGISFTTLLTARFILTTPYPLQVIRVLCGGKGVKMIYFMHSLAIRPV